MLGATVLLIDKERSGRRALIADLQLGAAASGGQGRSGARYAKDTNALEREENLAFVLVAARI